MNKMQRTETTTRCPFKGLAHYYAIDAGKGRLRDAAWTYEDPYLEHAALKDRIAFYDDKNPQIAIQGATTQH